MRAAIGSRVTRRHPARLPKTWLMTDERMGDGLWHALRRLPRGSGIVFRHYATPPAERRRLFGRVARIARQRGLVLVRAGAVPLGGGEAGTHACRGRGLVTWPAHDRGEAVRGARAGADLLFVSPVYATRSHPGAAPLGLAAARRIVAGLSVRAIVLGGVTPARGRIAMRCGFWGWAAIDAWS
ncbi:thiamine phosphate synthase [Hephaestia sp. CMS5P-6]|nr:thiamine phosphate synthase [Hephaestia mangrovi]MBY8829133.1 thiamine phosphate synthase [Hephaestia mangrovi]